MVPAPLGLVAEEHRIILALERDSLETPQHPGSRDAVRLSCQHLLAAVEAQRILASSPGCQEATDQGSATVETVELLAQLKSAEATAK